MPSLTIRSSARVSSTTLVAYTAPAVAVTKSVEIFPSEATVVNRGTTGPTNPLAVVIGRSVLLTWDSDDSIAYYNIYVSHDESGVYDLLSGRVFGNYFLVDNFPIGSVAEFRIEGCIGTNSYTEIVDIKLGRLQSKSVKLKVVGVTGTKILQGAMLVLRSSSGHPVLVSFPNEVIIG